MSHEARDLILREITATFAEHIDDRLHVEEGVWAEIREAFDKLVQPHLDSGRMSWEQSHRQRRFVLACAAGAGRLASKLAEEARGMSVTRRIAIDAARRLVPSWELTCTLPPVHAPDGASELREDGSEAAAERNLRSPECDFRKRIAAFEREEQEESSERAQST